VETAAGDIGFDNQRIGFAQFLAVGRAGEISPVPIWMLPTGMQMTIARQRNIDSGHG
jgi:hypothetical protein